MFTFQNQTFGGGSAEIFQLNQHFNFGLAVVIFRWAPERQRFVAVVLFYQHVVIKLFKRGFAEFLAQNRGLPYQQKRAVKTGVAGEQVVYKNMAETFFHIGAG
jgi:hypothetical protein